MNRGLSEERLTSQNLPARAKGVGDKGGKQPTDKFNLKLEREGEKGKDRGRET